MRQGNEEIFVSLIVVRRPERPSAETINPGEWAQSVLESLRAGDPKYQEGLGRGVAVSGRDLGLPRGSQRYDRDHRPATQRRRTCLFVLSAACFAGAAYSIYLTL